MKILYVEDNPLDSDLARRELSSTSPDIQLEIVATVRDALAHLEEPESFDLALIDMLLPDGNGLDLLMTIRRQALPLAVVLITGQGDEASAVAALKGGADDYIVKQDDYLARLPVILEDALHRFRAHRSLRAHSLRVLYVEHNPADIDLTRRHFGQHAVNIRLTTVGTGEEAFEQFSAEEWDVLLLDYRLPGMNALEMIKTLRQERGSEIPIVLVTGQGDEETALQAIKLGASDYVSKNPGYLYQLPGLLENAHYYSQLAREQAALQESEKKYRRLFTTVPIGWAYHKIILDENKNPVDYEFLEVNEAFEKITGLKREDILGKRVTRVIPGIEDTELDLISYYGKTALTGEHDSMEFYFEPFDKWYVSTVSSPEKGYFIVVFEDITERVQAEKEKRQMETHLRQEQKLASIGTLASGVAHEINNPLMGIMNYAQLIHDRIDPAEGRLLEFSAGIIEETERVAVIVRNLLTFAQQDRHIHSSANISDIVEDTLSLIRTIIKRDQITLEVDLPDELPVIKCRSQQIQQVLMNLLTNARDALNQRYPEYHPDKIIRVRVDPFEKDGRRWLRITVEDHGAGIPNEIRERIFDPFYTTKDRATGTGLGLSISLGIVQDHHGELTFESEEGQPTRFYLDLPVNND